MIHYTQTERSKASLASSCGPPPACDGGQDHSSASRPACPNNLWGSGRPCCWRPHARSSVRSSRPFLGDGCGALERWHWRSDGKHSRHSRWVNVVWSSCPSLLGSSAPQWSPPSRRKFRRPPEGLHTQDAPWGRWIRKHACSRLTDKRRQLLFDQILFASGSRPLKSPFRQSSLIWLCS